MPPRKHGAQPGNKNALKHGLYARHYPEEFKRSFLKWELDDYAAEIQLLRVSMDKIAERMLRPNPDQEALSVQVNALSNAVTSLVNASRQHILFNSRESPVLIAWESSPGSAHGSPYGWPEKQLSPGRRVYMGSPPPTSAGWKCVILIL
jgi:hypothetical protein